MPGHGTWGRRGLEWGTAPWATVGTQRCKEDSVPQWGEGRGSVGLNAGSSKEEDVMHS